MAKMTMKDKTGQPPKKHKSRGGSILPALCSILGTLIILTVILLCAPLTVPRLFGYQVFHVISGSMEPTVPVGSVIYTRQEEPEQIEEGSIIAFRKNGETVTHRVVDNHRVEKEFITRGDANEITDFEPVPYGDLVGRVVYHMPLLGRVLAMLAGTVGKAYLLLLALCGAMFNILAARLRENRKLKAEVERGDLRRERERDAQILNDELPKYTADSERCKPEEMSGQESRKRSPDRAVRTVRERKSRKHFIRFILLSLLLSVFVVSLGAVSYIRRQYREAEERYAMAAERFTAVSKPVRIEIPISPPQMEEKIARLPELAPITVDFDLLLEVNPDIVGWIYCPGTVINYPVLHGENNDSYLHTNYDGTYNAAGSIFVEEKNRRDFQDCNSILYGHHMANGSMFATLDSWQKQTYFDEHDVMWLLTPEQDYKIVLYSAYTTSAYDEVYTVFSETGDEFRQWLDRACKSSAVASGTVPDPEGKHVMLSTCAYVFDNARSVVHGELIPVSSAGGGQLT